MSVLPSHLQTSLRHTDTKDTTCQGCSCWQACSLPRCLEQIHELVVSTLGLFCCVLCVPCVGALVLIKSSLMAPSPLTHWSGVLSPGLVNTYKGIRRSQSSHPAALWLGSARCGICQTSTNTCLITSKASKLMS